MRHYLDFENPIKEIIEQIEQAKELEEKSQVDVSKTTKALEKKLRETQKSIYSKLTPCQKVQVSRHPERPYTLSYIKAITEGDFIELHGNRNVKDDKAMVGGIGTIDGQSIMFIGQQKGVNTKLRQYRNFGMANPEG